MPQLIRARVMVLVLATSLLLAVALPAAGAPDGSVGVTGTIVGSDSQISKGGDPSVAAVKVPSVEPRSVASQAPAQPSKIHDSVARFVAEVATARREGRSAQGLSNALIHATPNGDVELLVHALGTLRAAHLASLRDLGVRVVDTVTDLDLRKLDLPPVGLAHAWIPYDRVDDVAGLKWVAVISPPGYGETDPHPQNGQVSEGVAMHNADDAQTRGINGAGVNVGVISDGVQNLATAQANNELPAVTVLDAGSADEGTAMLEIVHDMAPGAGLFFDGGAASLTDYVNALNSLAGVTNVITEDLFWSAEPAFQRGLGAQTAENIAAGNVSVHSSAGNRGQNHTARVVATGTGQRPDGTSNTFTGCTNAPDNVVDIDPGAGTAFDVQIGGQGGTFTLQWSEPRAIFPTAGAGGFTDLNLYVMNAGLTQCLFQSTGAQGGGVGDTIEQVVVPATSSGTNVKLVVDVQGATGAAAVPTIDLRWSNGNNTATDTPTRAGSINPDSNYIGNATSAAAVNANSGAIEAFSSAGPVQLMTTTSCPGGAPGACVGVAGPATVTANGPNWAAADGVDISGAGGFGSTCAAGTCFFGTSASAPHAGACDALLRDETNSPNAAASTTNARLAATSTDIAPAGIDPVTGAGQLDCLAAINDPPTADAGGPYNTPEGTDAALNGSGSSDPDTGDTLTYAWDLDNDGQFDDSSAQNPTFDRVGQDGAFTVRLRVTDTAGASDTDSSTVTVSNVAPTVTLGTNAPKNEGSAVAVTGTISDPGWLENLSGTIDWQDGTTEPVTGTLENNRPDATLSLNLSHIYGDNGTYNVKVCGKDDDTTTCQTVAVKINNVDPAVSTDPGQVTTIQEGQTVKALYNWQDPGWLDTYSSEVSWGTNVFPPETGTFVSTDHRPDPDKGTLTASKQYGDNGSYEIKGTVKDDDGGTGTDLFTLKVNNVNPTALIDRTNTTLINGTPTFLNSAGQPIDFKGNSKDPGSDDLTLTWDWGDGPPSPDEVTLSLVSPPFPDTPQSPHVKARDVDDSKTHAFADACLYEITFASTDDDSGNASDKAAVVITGLADKTRSEGNWQHQYRRNGNTNFTDEELECYLAIVGYVSRVFNEKRDASTIPLAHDVLFMKQNGGSATEHFDRGLLTALLNFADGSIDWTDTVNGVTFGDALKHAEDVRLNPASSKKSLQDQEKILSRY